MMHIRTFTIQHHTKTTPSPLKRLRPNTPIHTHHIFGCHLHIQRSFKHQGSRIRRIGALGAQMTSFSSFYPLILRLDSSLASS
ncbi:hypothetical protein Hanom_Chr04g00295161 [Helianthus anomalus]